MKIYTKAVLLWTLIRLLRGENDKTFLFAMDEMDYIMDKKNERGVR